VQRSLLIVSAVAACLCLIISSAARAGIASGDTVLVKTSGTVSPAGTLNSLVPGHTSNSLVGHGSGGGEFLLTVQPSSPNAGSNFLTFCVETNEHITDGGKYQVIISDSANKGGSGGGTPDPLDANTQWLFQQYYLGNLDTLTSSLGNQFSYNVSTSANALQTAIWHLEGEVSTGSFTVPALGGLSQTLFDLANNVVLASPAADEHLPYNPLDGVVSVAQLYKVGDVVGGQLKAPTWNYSPTFYQDQLVFTPPENIGSVPEANSVVAWCILGLAGGGFCWRRRVVKSV
jgi:hypothetical protein